MFEEIIATMMLRNPSVFDIPTGKIGLRKRPERTVQKQLTKSDVEALEKAERKRVRRRVKRIKALLKEKHKE